MAVDGEGPVPVQKLGQDGIRTAFDDTEELEEIGAGQERTEDVVGGGWNRSRR